MSYTYNYYTLVSQGFYWENEILDYGLFPNIVPFQIADFAKYLQDQERRLLKRQGTKFYSIFLWLGHSIFQSLTSQ